MPLTVIPAQAGIQWRRDAVVAKTGRSCSPACVGMTSRDRPRDRLKFRRRLPINWRTRVAPAAPTTRRDMSEQNGSKPLQLQYLTVNLAQEEYGIDILAVREIRGWTPVTRIPQAPHYVLGVLNLRGAIVPVLDLRLRFGLAREEYGATTVTVVITVAGRLFGVVVDGVSDVLDVVEQDVRPVPDMGTAVDTEYLKGLTSAAERMVLLLDVDKLLQPQDAQMLEAALPAVADVKAVA
jgi:purine-binding chemotaxis protein CheW